MSKLLIIFQLLFFANIRISANILIPANIRISANMLISVNIRISANMQFPVTRLFACHHADDFLICPAHAYPAEPSDIAYRVFYALDNDAVSVEKFPSPLVHEKTQNSRIHGKGDFRGAGSFCTGLPCYWQPPCQTDCYFLIFISARACNFRRFPLYYY